MCAVPSGQVEDALERIECSAAVVTLDPHTLDDVLQGIVTVAEAAGVRERGHELVLQLRVRLDAVAAALLGTMPPAAR